MTITREQAIEMATDAGFGFHFRTCFAEKFERLCSIAAAHQAKQDEELMRMAFETLIDHGAHIGGGSDTVDALRNRLDGV